MKEELKKFWDYLIQESLAKGDEESFDWIYDNYVQEKGVLVIPEENIKNIDIEEFKQEWRRSGNVIKFNEELNQVKEGIR